MSQIQTNNGSSRWPTWCRPGRRSSPALSLRSGLRPGLALRRVVLVASFRHIQARPMTSRNTSVLLTWVQLQWVIAMYLYSVALVQGPSKLAPQPLWLLPMRVECIEIMFKMTIYLIRGLDCARTTLEGKTFYDSHSCRVMAAQSGLVRNQSTDTHLTCAPRS